LKTSIDHFTCLLVLAGVSGAGKSTALHTLSDLGFYVIDNLPLPLVPKFVQFSRASPQKYEYTALLLDIDSKEKLEQLIYFLEYLKRPSNLKLMFLDCAKETIIKRYSETRRPHPSFDAVKDKTLEDAIVREKELLLPFKEKAHMVIDTTLSTVHDLRREVKAFVDSLSSKKAGAIRVNFISFGFKYGIPLDCDLVVDVRFLPNPHFISELRDKTGLHEDVAKYVLKNDAATQFVNKYAELLNFLLPQYAFEGKSYINIGVGCTGGKHRSVAIAHELFKRMPQEGYLVSMKHRDALR
jgi:RNase adapter protein RapZ